MSAPKPSLLEATETDISVQFKPSSGSTYMLQWKQYNEDWQGAKSKPVSTAGSSQCKAQASPLEPGTTYCVRLVCDGAPGPDLVVDTEQVGCTPKQKGGCVVM